MIQVLVKPRSDLIAGRGRTNQIFAVSFATTRRIELWKRIENTDWQLEYLTNGTNWRKKIRVIRDYNCGLIVIAEAINEEFSCQIDV